MFGALRVQSCLKPSFPSSCPDSSKEQLILGIHRRSLAREECFYFLHGLFLATSLFKVHFTRGKTDSDPAQLGFRFTGIHVGNILCGNNSLLPRERHDKFGVTPSYHRYIPEGERSNGGGASVAARNFSTCSDSYLQLPSRQCSYSLRLPTRFPNHLCWTMT